jgi:hypothetical protein
LITSTYFLDHRSLHWSFQTERYFGKNGAEVKKTRFVKLLPKRAEETEVAKPSASPALAVGPTALAEESISEVPPIKSIMANESVAEKVSSAPSLESTILLSTEEPAAKSEVARFGPDRRSSVLLLGKVPVVESASVLSTLQSRLSMGKNSIIHRMVNGADDAWRRNALGCGCFIFLLFFIQLL